MGDILVVYLFLLVLIVSVGIFVNLAVDLIVDGVVWVYRKFWKKGQIKLKNDIGSCVSWGNVESARKMCKCLNGFYDIHTFKVVCVG